MPHSHNQLFSRQALGWLCAAATLISVGARADWPEFRGPTGDGYVPVAGGTRLAGLPLRWSETENLRWRTPIHDRGLSTPVILSNQVWLTTATEAGHDFFVLCLDAATGKVLFDEKLFHCDNPESQGNNVNSYATPSPVIEPGRVYVHFGSYGTACLDTATHQVLWQRQDLPCRHFRGASSSPVLFENLLILTLDGADLQYLVALDKQTGKTVWKTNRSVAWNDADSTDSLTRQGDRRKAHSTPLLIEFAGKPQLLSAGAKAAYAYDPRTGRELWRVRHEAWSAASRPVYKDGLAFFISGFGGPTELLAVRVDGQGDVTDSHIVWRKADKFVPKTPSPILVEGLLYLVSDAGVVSCLECKTGREVWHESVGGSYAASPIFGDGRLYFCNQQGKTTVMQPGQTSQILATNVLANGMLASPAVSGKALFLRTRTDLVCIESGRPVE